MESSKETTNNFPEITHVYHEFITTNIDVAFVGTLSAGTVVKSVLELITN